MRDLYIQEAEETLLAMADIVRENRALRKRIEELELYYAELNALFYGKSGLHEKLRSQIFENLSTKMVASCGWLSSNEYRTLKCMDLTEEEKEFCRIKF